MTTCLAKISPCSCISKEASQKDERPILRFTNCRIVKNGTLVEEDLWIRGERIVERPPRFGTPKIVKVIDCQGDVIAPGYIDLQLNGGYGEDFCLDPRQIGEGCRTQLRDSIIKVAEQLPASGVTAFCPTFVTSTKKVFENSIPVVDALIDEKLDDVPRARVLGCHLEGPFISVAGAHTSELMKAPENGFDDLISAYGTLEGVKIVTIAPELPGSIAAIKGLRERDIVVSAGHTNATFDEAQNGVYAGVRLITHLYNAMRSHHRDPGLLGLLSDEREDLFFTIIADNVHTHPKSIQNAWRLHPKGLVLITDAILAMGMPSGDYAYHGVEIEVADGKIVLKGTNTLVGAIATMDECVRNLKRFTKCSLAEAVEAATLRPAEVLGIEQEQGTLYPGSYADINLMDDNLNIKRCWINGKLAFDFQNCLHEKGRL